MRPLILLSVVAFMGIGVPIGKAAPVFAASVVDSRAAIQNKDGSTTLPITLRGGHIYLDAQVNGKPARFVLDSGAGANVLTPEAAARLGILPDDKTLKATGAGGTEDVRAAKADKIVIGDALLENETAYVIPLPEALHCDGLLGYDLLRRFVATVDYDKKTLTLTDPKRFKAPDGAEALPLMVVKGNLPAVKGSVDGLPGIFHIDTGAGDALTLFRPFVERQGLRDKYTPRIETITGRGVGGYLYADVVRIKALTLGKLEISAVVTELSNQKTGVFASESSAGNIGAEVLSRFTVTIDYPDKRLYLTKNSHFDDPFVFNRAGLGLDSDQGKIVVAAVIPSSPGSEAGILAGDTLIAVDGVGVDKIDSEDIRNRLRAAAGTKIELLVRTGDKGTPRKAVVTLRDLL